jgi:hypothetical protein
MQPAAFGFRGCVGLGGAAAWVADGWRARAAAAPTPGPGPGPGQWSIVPPRTHCQELKRHPRTGLFHDHGQFSSNIAQNCP